MCPKRSYSNFFRRTIILKKVIILLFILVPGLVLTSAAKADIILHWRFDETFGTTLHDASGNGQDGTLIGDPKWVPAKLGRALEFDDSDDAVELGTFDVVGPGITLTGWIRTDALGINDGCGTGWSCLGPVDTQNRGLGQ